MLYTALKPCANTNQMEERKNGSHRHVLLQTAQHILHGNSNIYMTITESFLGTDHCCKSNGKPLSSWPTAHWVWQNRPHALPSELGKQCK